MELDNDIDEEECPELRVASAAANVPGLIQPTWKSRRDAEKVLVRVNESK